MAATQVDIPLLHDLILINLSSQMLGAYPRGSKWDFAVGKKDDGHFKHTWNIPKPEKDPILGVAREGLCGTWV